MSDIITVLSIYRKVDLSISLLYSCLFHYAILCVYFLKYSTHLHPNYDSFSPTLPENLAKLVLLTLSGHSIHILWSRLDISSSHALHGADGIIWLQKWTSHSALPMSSSFTVATVFLWLHMGPKLVPALWLLPLSSFSPFLPSSPFPSFFSFFF